MNPNDLKPNYQRVLLTIELGGGEAYLSDIADLIHEKKKEHHTEKKLEYLAERNYINEEKIDGNNTSVYSLNDFEKDLDEDSKSKYHELKLKYRKALD